MANRDQSQKVAFVYSNIYQLYKKAQASAKDLPEAKVLRADELSGAEVTSFQPPVFKGATAPSAASPAPGNAAPNAANSRQNAFISPFDDLKSNLSKLQDLHSKLRFMLKELEDLVEKKK